MAEQKDEPSIVERVRRGVMIVLVATGALSASGCMFLPPVGTTGFVKQCCFGSGTIAVGLAMLAGALLYSWATTGADDEDADGTEIGTKGSESPDGTEEVNHHFFLRIGIGFIGLAIAILGVAMSEDVVRDIPYLSDPCEAYLDDAHCRKHVGGEGTDGEYTEYLLEGYDKGSDTEHAFVVDGDVSGQILDGFAVVKYLPNTGVALEISYQ